MTRTIMTQRAPAPMTPVHKTRWDGPGLGEFIAMMAALMAVNALAIDSMLPALPAIGDALNVSEDNRRQLVITAYLLGFGGAQLPYGPISDRLGRKTILAGSLFRSEEHTSELQSLMRISYAVFCLKKQTQYLTLNT